MGPGMFYDFPYKIHIINLPASTIVMAVRLKLLKDSAYSLYSPSVYRQEKTIILLPIHPFLPTSARNSKKQVQILNPTLCEIWFFLISLNLRNSHFSRKILIFASGTRIFNILDTCERPRVER